MLYVLGAFALRYVFASHPSLFKQYPNALFIYRSALEALTLDEVGDVLAGCGDGCKSLTDKLKEKSYTGCEIFLSVFSLFTKNKISPSHIEKTTPTITVKLQLYYVQGCYWSSA